MILLTGWNLQLTGGIGREALSAFYRDHFIFSNPDDTELELISRTVGIDRVVDEFIFKFTHTTMIDWLYITASARSQYPCTYTDTRHCYSFPGLQPTGRKVQIPMMAVVNVRGDRLYHEHISWDQATALAQLGLLPTYGDSEVKAGQNNAIGSEMRLPIAGVETAAKIRNKNSVESNGMIP